MKRVRVKAQKEYGQDENYGTDDSGPVRGIARDGRPCSEWAAGGSARGAGADTAGDRRDGVSDALHAAAGEGGRDQKDRICDTELE